MFKLKGVHHLGLPVNDMERAKKFYTEEVISTTARRIYLSSLRKKISRPLWRT